MGTLLKLPVTLLLEKRSLQVRIDNFKRVFVFQCQKECSHVQIYSYSVPSIDYGENWLDARAGTFTDFVPREQEFEKSATLFQKINKELKFNKVPVTDAVLKTMKSIASGFEPRVAGLLPETAEVFNNIEKSQSRKNPIKNMLADNTIQKRSVEWIKANGICLDNIRPGKSTIPDAGRGAFAQGYISSGTIISPAPLLNVKDKVLLNMYNLLDEETGELVALNEDHKVIGQQILVNYCFGHMESPLLLCPQSNMILMNHCSTRKPGKGHCGNKGPNAKVQWAHSWDEDTPDWLDMSLDDISDKTASGRRGLSIEVVATRNVSPGEEITIDYGENWEKAYEAHVESWVAPVDDGTYIPVRTMIDNKDFRTVDELKDHPYPDNVINVCYYYSETEEEEADDGEVVEVEKSGEDFVPTAGMDSSLYLFRCEIVQKPSDTENETYTVRVFSKEQVLLTDYPEESISFRMKEYKSDVHLPGAFRHFIEIPVDIFPNQWKTTVKAEE